MKPRIPIGVDSMLRRIRISGLADSHLAVLSAMDEWADNYGEPQPKKDIERRSGYTKVYVNVMLHAFEQLGYIRLLRPKKPALGHRVILMYLPDEWYQKTGKQPDESAV